MSDEKVVLVTAKNARVTYEKKSNGNIELTVKANSGYKITY